MTTANGGYTAEQVEAVTAMGAALESAVAAMSRVAELGLDPLPLILSSLTPEQVEQLPLPLRMMFG